MFRLTNTNLILIGVIVVLALGLFFMYSRSQSGDSHSGSHSGKEEMTSSGQEPSPVPMPKQAPSSSAKMDQPCLVLFHADWCPHCKDMLPEWEKLRQIVDGKVMIVDLESKNPMMAQFSDLKGLPTVRFYHQGLDNKDKFAEYEGDRTADTMLKFLQSQL